MICSEFPLQVAWENPTNLFSLQEKSVSIPCTWQNGDFGMKWSFPRENSFKALFNLRASLLAIIVTSFIFPPKSDMGTVVFFAKKNYNYYFDYSTRVLPWVQCTQVPIFFSQTIEFRGWYWCSWTHTNFCTKYKTPRVLVSCFWWIEINSYSLIKSPEKELKCNSLCMILF